jgi:acyl CoA:acetate/3-ketoacid CoA transferase beta subunit
MSATRAEIVALAIAEAFRSDGEVLASPMGVMPSIGARLAKATWSPDLLLTDGVARIVAGIHPVGRPLPDDVVVEGFLPYAGVFDVVWSGRRHVMMGASQIDAFGNQNISCVGPHARPKVQLIGARGAPGNTIHHPTSYYVGNHSRRVFVQAVDAVCGVGNDRAAALGAAGRFHEIRAVVTNLCVLDSAPSGRLRLASLHPGVELAQVVESTGFALELPGEVPTSRLPTDEELRLIREVIDPDNLRARQVAG